MSNLRAAPAALNSERVSRLIALIRGEDLTTSSPAKPRLRLGVADCARPPIRRAFIENGADAVSFLRRDGISVKAVEGPHGNLWLMSGQVEPVDIKTVVALATARGFRG